MERKVKIIYKLSKEAQRCATIKSSNPYALQSVICEYKDYMKDLIKYDGNKIVIDTRYIIYNYTIKKKFGYVFLCRETGKTFNYIPTQEELLNWIKEQVESREIKYKKVYKKYKKLNKNNGDVLADFIFIIYLAVLFILFKFFGFWVAFIVGGVIFLIISIYTRCYVKKVINGIKNYIKII